MLPVINAGAFLADPHSSGGVRFVEQLREAWHGPGFCFLVGHGIDRALDAEIMEQSRQFFALPERERRAIAIGNSPHFRGYTILGDERTQGKRDWRDQIDIGPEEPALSLSGGDPPWLRLRGPNQWPENVPGLRPAVAQWMQAIDQLGTAMMRALALGLEQPMDRFDAAIQPHPYTRLKIIRYPAQPAGMETGQGLGLHQDSGLLSFILQDEVGGLQVETDHGVVDIVPRPDAYMMNLGEMLQAATGGFLRATHTLVLKGARIRAPVRASGAQCVHLV